MNSQIHPPVISVIMSAYNGQKYLKEAVESVLQQTFADFEFLIIDDGSTDETEVILKSYHDARIRLIKNEKNIGLTRSLNKGIKLGKGVYFARQDTDDISLPHRFACQVEYLESHPEVVALGAQLSFIDEDGLTIGKEARVTQHDDIVAMLMRGSGALPHPVVMMRAHQVRAIGGYREKFVVAQDVDLWLRLAERGRLANLDKVLLKYRFHEKQIGSTKRELQRIATRKAILDAYHRQGKLCPANVEVEGPFEVPPWKLHCNWSRMAFKAGNRRTAIKHAMISVRQMPLSKTAWLLLFKTICPRALSQQKLIQKYVQVRRQHESEAHN